MTVNQAGLRRGAFAALAAIIAACAPQADPVESADGERRAPAGLRYMAAEPPAGARIAARVGDTVLTVEDVRREAALREIVEAPEALEPGSPAFREVLDELIDQRLLALEAARRGLQTDPEARQRLAAAEERILGNVLVEQAVSDAVTDEAVLRVYEEQSRLAPPAEEVRARHILVDTRNEADEVARLLAEGADFATLAASISQDPATRFEGGDLGYFTREGILPAFAAVAFELAPGAVSAPFQSETGWHVMTVVDRRFQARPGLEAMRPNIMRFLTLKGIDSLLEEIRGAYPVTIVAAAAPEGLRADPPAPAAASEPPSGAADPSDAPADPEAADAAPDGQP